MRKFFREFRDFIQKGNVLDLAVGIIIGTAFNKIVSSLVNDIIMPIIGLIGGRNIQEGKWVLVDAVVDAEGKIIKNAVTLNYGNFLQFIIDFLIIALTVFIILKVVKGMRKKAEEAKEKIINLHHKEESLVEEEQTKEEELAEEIKEEIVPVESKPTTEELLVEIRDLLQENTSNK